MEKKTIGSFIAVLRKASGMTQRELAEKLNVSDKAVSRWERDETLPDLTMIPVLADIFGVTTDELLRGQRLTAEIPSAQNEEKLQRQLKYLLEKTQTDYKIYTLISLLVAALGIIAAAVLNLAFLRAVAGFWVGCVFFLVAAVLQTIFKIKCDARLRGEEFEGEALASCKRKLKKYTYWTITAIAALFMITLPLALVYDAHWGLPLRNWLRFEQAGYVHPAVWVLLIAGIIWLFYGGALSGSSPKHKLRRRSVLVLVAVLAGTMLAHEVLQEALDANRHWFGQATAYRDWEEFKAFAQTPLSPEGEDYEYNVTNQDGDRILSVSYYDPSTGRIESIGQRGAWWNGQSMPYIPLNRQVAYVDSYHDGVIYTYTQEQYSRTNIIIACILHPLLVVYPIEIFLAVRKYRKKVKNLQAA